MKFTNRKIMIIGVIIAGISIGYTIFLDNTKTQDQIPSTTSVSTIQYGTLSGNVSKTDFMPCVYPCKGRIFYPSANYEVDVYANDKVTLIGKTFSDVNANYSIHLPAGNYTIFTGVTWYKHANQVSVFADKITIFNIVWGDTA